MDFVIQTLKYFFLRIDFQYLMTHELSGQIPGVILAGFE